MKNSSPFPAMFACIAFLVGLNLRPILAAVGPLFPVLQHETGLSATGFSLLTTLPVAMMGLAALGGPALLKHIGAVRGIAAGLALLTVACFLRGFTASLSGLMVTALIGGAGIGLIQALMPALIKTRSAQAAATLMSLFTTGIMAGAAVAAASAEPVFVQIGLLPTLASAGALAFVTLLIWLVRIKPQPVKNAAAEPVTLSSARTGLLLLFFGIGTGAYTLVLAWLPPFYMQSGWSARSSGFILAGLTLTEVAAGFMVSMFIQRVNDRRIPLLLVLLMLLAGLLCLICFPGTTPVISTLLLGTGIGALFPLSLIVTLDHARTAQQAGKLLARVQGGGYLIASLMPLIAGVVRDSTPSLNGAWLAMSAGVMVMMLMAWRLRPVQ